MPWSNQDSGGREPGGLQQGPDLPDLLKAKQRKLKPMMPGGSGIPGAIPIIAAIVLAVTVASFAFTFRVYPDEMGVVMRFGKVTRQEPPGLHFRMPYPIDEVRLPKVTRQNIVEIGRVTRGFADVGAVREGSMTLTGDENIVDVALVVLWRIEDAVQYLFNIQNREPLCKRWQRAPRARWSANPTCSRSCNVSTSEDRAGCVEAHAGCAGSLWCRHSRRAGTAAQGRSAGSGHRRIPQRPSRSHR